MSITPIDKNNNVQSIEPSYPKKAIIISGAAFGAAVGSAAGAVFGPIGILAGAVAGAVVGVFAALATIALNALLDRQKPQSSKVTAESSSKPQISPHEIAESILSTLKERKDEIVQIDGIGRVPGQQNEIINLINGKTKPNEDGLSLFSIFDALKKMIREERLINIIVGNDESISKNIHEISELIENDKNDEAINRIKTSINQEPLIKEFFLLLKDIAANHEINKMNANNLAICIAPALTKQLQKNIDPLTYLSKTPRICEFMILQAGEIFNS